MYNNNYISAYGTAGIAACKSSKDGHIDLINPDGGGKVAVVAHGAFGTTLAGATCTTDHYDMSLLGAVPDTLVKNSNALPAATITESYMNGPDAVWGGKAFTKFNILKAQLGEMFDDMTGTDTTAQKKWADVAFVRTNANGSKSCLIKTSVFKNAGVALPSAVDTTGSATGLTNVSNDGVAISWGHGLGDGACGAVTLMQQGGDGPQAGNTILNFQIGTRAWSGEFSDSTGKQGYITEGLAGANDSASCLQPKFRTLSLEELIKLLTKLPPANEIASGANGLCTNCAAGSGGDCQASCGGACYPIQKSTLVAAKFACPGGTSLCKPPKGAKTPDIDSKTTVASDVCSPSPPPATKVCCWSTDSDKLCKDYSGTGGLCSSDNKTPCDATPAKVAACPEPSSSSTSTPSSVCCWAKSATGLCKNYSGTGEVGKCSYKGTPCRGNDECPEDPTENFDNRQPRQAHQNIEQYQSSNNMFGFNLNCV